MFPNENAPQSTLFPCCGTFTWLVSVLAYLEMGLLTLRSLNFHKTFFFFSVFTRPSRNTPMCCQITSDFGEWTMPCLQPTFLNKLNSLMDWKLLRYETSIRPQSITPTVQWLLRSSASRSMGSEMGKIILEIFPEYIPSPCLTCQQTTVTQFKTKVNVQLTFSQRDTLEYPPFTSAVRKNEERMIISGPVALSIRDP
jgi:hypothetical protein